jgi:hypothetical protein
MNSNISLKDSVNFINNFNLDERLAPISETEIEIAADKLRSRISTLETSREKIHSCVNVIKTELENKQYDENLSLSLAVGDSLITAISNRILQFEKELVSKKTILEKIVYLCKTNIKEYNSEIKNIQIKINEKQGILSKIYKSDDIKNLEGELEKFQKLNEGFRKKMESAKDALLNIDGYLKKDQHAHIYSEGALEQALTQFNQFIVPTRKEMEKLYPTEKRDLDSLQNMKEQILFVEEHKSTLQNIIETIKKQKNLKNEDVHSTLNPIIPSYAVEKLEAPIKELDQLISQLKNKQKLLCENYSVNQQRQKLDSQGVKSNFEQILEYEVYQLSQISEKEWVSFNPFDSSIKNWKNENVIFALDTKGNTVTSSHHNVYVITNGEWQIQLKSPENNVRKWISPQELKSQVHKDILILSKLSPHDLIPSQIQNGVFFTTDHAFGISEENGKFRFATNLNSSPPLSYQVEDGKWNFHSQNQNFLPEVVPLKESYPDAYWTGEKDNLH